MSKTWSISEIARLTGTTSRTLRHYDAIGLLPPSAVAANGYRHYDAYALIRLQRILGLRDLGMALSEIAAVLEHQRNEIDALEALMGQLEGEAHRLQRQIQSVQRTIQTLKSGGELMAENMFEGWDNSQYKDEVIERWGREAWDASAQWWASKSPAEWQAYQEMATREIQEWIRLANSGIAPESDEAQAHAQLAVERVNEVPGTPGYSGGDVATWVRNLAALYISDDRWMATYGGPASAQFVHDALVHWADTHTNP